MPQKSRSRLGFLSGYDDRRIAVRSEWRRSMCARMRRTITDFLPKGRNPFARLSALAFLASRGHRQVHAPAFPVSPFVQSHDDFFHGQPYGLDISLLIAPDRVTSLLDDIAVPARTRHVTGWICRFYRNNCIVFFDQGNSAPPGSRRPRHASPSASGSENRDYGRDRRSSYISG